MSGSRPSLFEDDAEPEINLAQFSPIPKADQSPVPDAAMRQLSEVSGFPSRQAASPTVGKLTTAQSPPAGTPKTGRTVLLNARITPRAHARFHELVATEAQRYQAGEITHRVTLGEMVEMALAALERELAVKGRRL